MFPGVQRKIRPCGWKEHGEVGIPPKIQLNRTAGSEDISLPSWSIPGRRSDGLIFLIQSLTDEPMRSCHLDWKLTVRCLPRHLHMLVTKQKNNRLLLRTNKRAPRRSLIRASRSKKTAHVFRLTCAGKLEFKLVF